QVNFTTLSSGLMTYRWSFGDGFTSTQANPTNVYTEPGIYVVTLYGTDAEGCSNMAVKTIEVQGAVTSTQEQTELAAQLQLFPNPAQDLIHLQMDLPQQDQVNLQVVDLFGKVILNQDLGQLQSGIIPVDIAALPTGTYLVNVRVGNTRVGKRFVKY
ncbi:MAG: PKD domain-containing protein, partial [Bacteroidota bacterium]